MIRKENYLCHMRIYLIGYMGSGKSTLGKSLAEGLGLKWIDMDSEFETRYKISISDFFSKYDEKTFRELEHKILLDISVIPGIVVSTGGGLPCFHNNMQLMNQTGITIYLQASPELIISRIEPLSRTRPLFHQMKGENLVQKISDHLDSRQVYYKLAKITIDALSPDISNLKTKIAGFNSKTIAD